MLLIEHRLTPPGAWVPDQPILTDIGLASWASAAAISRVRSIQCDGYTATWVPSPADPDALVQPGERFTGDEAPSGVAKARVRLVPHGRADPIATNSTEPAAVSTAASSSPSSTSSSSVPERDATARLRYLRAPRVR